LGLLPQFCTLLLYYDFPSEAGTVVAVKNKKINNLELKYLLKKAADDMMTVSQISLVGKLFVEGMPFKKAISASDKYCIMRIDSIALKTELASAMKKEKVSSKKEFMKKLVNEKYPSLIF